MICKFGFYSSDIGVNINPLHDLTPTEENQGSSYNSFSEKLLYFC